jgi:hypothetical protein
MEHYLQSPRSGRETSFVRLSLTIDPPFQQGSREMHTMAAGVTAIIFLSATAAAISAGETSRCSDKNKLNGGSVDARLVAIEFYYHGVIEGLPDGDRKSCFAVRVLNAGKLDIVNKTLDLIERDCLPIAQAARTVADGVCP